MDPLVLTIGIIAIVLLIIVLGTIYYKNKFQFTLVKINEAENNIDIYLQKKLDILCRIVPVIKDNLKEGTEDFEKVLLLKSKNINSFELNTELEKGMHQFIELLDINPSLNEVEEISTLQCELEENEDDLEASKKYYNDNVAYYNRYVHVFPSNLVGFIFRYHHKEFYSDEKEEMFHILKD